MSSSIPVGEGELTEIEDRLEALAKKIERLQAGAVRRIGKYFAEARQLFRYRRDEGGFAGWVERRLKIHRATAYRAISVYEHLGSECVALCDTLPAGVLYLLAAPSTPDEARTEVIEKANAGETVSVADTKEVIARHRESKDELGAGDVAGEIAKPPRTRRRRAKPLDVVNAVRTTRLSHEPFFESAILADDAVLPDLTDDDQRKVATELDTFIALLLGVRRKLVGEPVISPHEQGLQRRLDAVLAENEALTAELSELKDQLCLTELPKSESLPALATLGATVSIQALTTILTGAGPVRCAQALPVHWHSKLVSNVDDRGRDELTSGSAGAGDDDGLSIPPELDRRTRLN